MWEKLSVKHFIRFFALMITLISIWFLGKEYLSSQFRVAKDINQSKNLPLSEAETLHSMDPQVYSKENSLSHDQNNDFKNCLGFKLPIQSLDHFPLLLTKLGKNQRRWHWDNYHYQDAKGRQLTIHVVSDQNKSGAEIKKMKIFRQDEDGPTLLEEKLLINDSQLKDALKLRLDQGELKTLQTVDSFYFENHLEIKRTTENDQITELQFQNDQGSFICHLSLGQHSCQCQ